MTLKRILFPAALVLAVLLSGCASAQVKAAKSGDINALREYINSGGDVNEPERGGTTLLMYAAEEGQDEAIAFLLDNGARIGQKDNNGRTALIYAVIPGNVSSARLLLDRGADIGLILSSGDTSLILAASSQNRSMVSMLLEKGASLNAKNNNGWSALTTSLSKDAQRSSGVNQTSTYLMDQGAALDVSSSNVSTITFTAAAAGNLDVLKLILGKGFELEKLSSKGVTLLYTAAAANKVEVVRYLLSLGADWDSRDSQGWSALMRSLYNSASAGTGIDSVAQVLMDAGARPEGNSSQGETIAFKSVETGALEILGLMFQYSLNPGVRDSDGNTLLVAGVADQSVVSALLTRSVPVDTRNNSRDTALIIAAKKSYNDSLSLLLQAGAEVDLRDSSGLTALLHASKGSSAEPVRKLLIAGASIHSTDNKGNTALHYAASSGVPDTVRLLLTAGVYVDPTNGKGERPYDLSFNNKRYGDQIREILAQAGAYVPPVQLPEVEPGTAAAVVPSQTSEVEESQAVQSSQTSDSSSTASSSSASNSSFASPSSSTSSSSTAAAATTTAPVASEPAVSVSTRVNLSVSYGWHSINPSSVKGWNNSDKLTGAAILQIGEKGSSSWLYDNTLDIPMRGANADRNEGALSLGSGDAGEYRAVLSLPTRKGNKLVSEITAQTDLEGRLIFYFDSFIYED